MKKFFESEFSLILKAFYVSPSFLKRCLLVKDHQVHRLLTRILAHHLKGKLVTIFTKVSLKASLVRWTGFTGFDEFFIFIVNRLVILFSFSVHLIHQYRHLLSFFRQNLHHLGLQVFLHHNFNIKLHIFTTINKKRRD